jgi:hypothetical protein
MALTVQNLRAVGPGVEPASLLPGQIAFNITEKVLYVGDGSNFKTFFDGHQDPAPTDGGWFEVPLGYQGLGDFYLLNPEQYGPVPTNGQILAYSSVTGKPYWEDASDLGGSAVYTTTNAAVAAAPGATTSEKISAAIGATPIEADSAIVTGLPGQTYQGLYLFKSGNWVFAAGYADPTAIQVPYDNAISGLVATTVQAALDELAASKLDIASNAPSNGNILSWSGGLPLWVTEESLYPTADQVSFDPASTGLPSFADTVQEALTLTWQLADDAKSEAETAQADATSAQNTANLALTNANNALSNSTNAVSTANNALAVANAALPKAGGTMTGNIAFSSGQPVDAGTF